MITMASRAPRVGSVFLVLLILCLMVWGAVAFLVRCWLERA